jgi:hypothetical protein
MKVTGNTDPVPYFHLPRLKLLSVLTDRHRLLGLHVFIKEVMKSCLLGYNAV